MASGDQKGRADGDKEAARWALGNVNEASRLGPRLLVDPPPEAPDVGGRGPEDGPREAGTAADFRGYVEVAQVQQSKTGQLGCCRLRICGHETTAEVVAGPRGAAAQTALLVAVAAAAACAVLSLGLCLGFGPDGLATGDGAFRGERGSPPRQLSETCNVSVAILNPTTRAPTFNLSEQWIRICGSVKPAPSQWATPQWKHQNNCWSWMKKVGCYEVQGTLSWWNGQRRAAKLGLAPFPELVPLRALREPEVCDWQELGAPQPSAAPATEAQAALAWFSATVAVYVLNLPRNQDRWANIAARLIKLGIIFRRVPGVDLAAPEAIEEAYREGLVPRGFDFALAQANARTEFQGMGGIMGTVGCAAAHLRAMKTVGESNRASQPLALILEDDVLLADDFVVKLRRLLRDEAPCDWNAISLQSRCPHGECVSPHLTRVLPDGNEPAERCRHGVNYGFFAMVYRVSTLQYLRYHLAHAVWNEDRPHCLDVDVALASISDVVAYYAVPSVQRPGFLSEGAQGSTRSELNQFQSPVATPMAEAATGFSADPGDSWAAELAQALAK